MKNVILTYQDKKGTVTFSCLLDAEFDIQQKGVQIKNFSHGVFALSKGEKIVRGIYDCMNKAIQFYIQANSSCVEILEEVADVLNAKIKDE